MLPKIWVLVPCLLLLASCAPPIDVTSENNVREEGTVVARAQVSAANTDGISNTTSYSAAAGASGAGYNLANGAIGSASSGSLASMGAAGANTLANIGNAVTLGLFTTTVDKSGIDYTITKDNGQTVHVIQFPKDSDDDPIFYPGQRVIIQTNGSYQRLMAPIN